MARDIFVCHSTEDRAVARAIVASLEASSVSCWIAPRDVVPGADYAESIVAGIAAAKAMVLVFSQQANQSPHVSREVERAASRRLPIIPYRVDGTPPAQSLNYFIGSVEWFDATAGDPASHAGAFAEAVRTQLYGAPDADPRAATRQVLRELIGRYGYELAGDARRVQALLRDMAGEHRAEVAVLVAAAEEGVGQSLLQSSEGLTPEVGERLARRLHENRALEEQAARWAVGAWMNALGLEAPEGDAPDPTGPDVAVPDTVAVDPAPTDLPPAPAQLPETVAAGPEPGRPTEAPFTVVPVSPPPARPIQTPGRSHRRRWGALVAGAAAVILLIGGVAWFAGQPAGDAVAFLPDEVFLEPIGVVERPFTASLLGSGPGNPPGSSTTLQVEGGVELVSVEGSHELYYAGIQGSSSCNPAILQSELDARPDVARVWAEAQGIDLAALPDFIASLTPVLLTQDARVTSHVLDDGRAIPRQGLLERGMAVLASPTGEPRVRCASGSPLVPPSTVEAPTYVGTAWSGFDPTEMVEIEPCDEPISEFVLRDSLTGEAFIRQVGSNVATDTALTTTTTVPPTTTTTSSTTTTSTTTTTTTTLPVADYDATNEGVVWASSRLCGSYSAAKAVDGDITTSWISGSGDGASSTFTWTASQDEFIGSISITSNAAHARSTYRTNHGFGTMRIQVQDDTGAVVFDETVALAGAPDPDVVEPNVVGRVVRLDLDGAEAPSASGFAEFVVMVAR